MKNKKGFTLVELLAVIVVLGIIMVLTASAVIETINESRKRTKYIAAKEIVEIASAYMISEGHTSSIDGDECVSVLNDLLASEYLVKDFTNPETGKNYAGESIENHFVCKVSENKEEIEEEEIEIEESKENYERIGDRYVFDKYYYLFQE